MREEEENYRKRMWGGERKKKGEKQKVKNQEKNIEKEKR